MIRFCVELTPNELKVLHMMLQTVLLDTQGDGTLSEQDDDDLTSLNAKLAHEIGNHNV